MSPCAKPSCQPTRRADWLPVGGRLWHAGPPGFVSMAGTLARLSLAEMGSDLDSAGYWRDGRFHV